MGLHGWSDAHLPERRCNRVKFLALVLDQPECELHERPVVWMGRLGPRRSNRRAGHPPEPCSDWVGAVYFRRDRDRFHPRFLVEFYVNCSISSVTTDDTEDYLK